MTKSTLLLMSASSFPQESYLHNNGLLKRVSKKTKQKKYTHTHD